MSILRNAHVAVSNLGVEGHSGQEGALYRIVNLEANTARWRHAEWVGQLGRQKVSSSSLQTDSSEGTARWRVLDLREQLRADPSAQQLC